ncbi:helix-turn-helix transcriptional regulator [Streptomyces sp. NPDC058128]|uniref:helix-turn-helix transcriptional regulator n=1 Tax=Streptomyces sp. NPDC058128 TaxID=3346352 RepID=UPI0036E23422
MLAGSTHIHTLVAAFRQAVEEDFTRTRTVSDHARRLGTSRWHLDTAVRQATGLTPKEHADARVIHEAKHLLAHSTLPAARVGTRLGFPDRATFGRFFRNRTGVTPAAFRAATPTPEAATRCAPTASKMSSR